MQGPFQPLPGNNKMLIMTEDGGRTIRDDLILCMDRPQTVGSHLVVTLYLLTGERIVGVVERREQEEFDIAVDSLVARSEVHPVAQAHPA